MLDWIEIVGWMAAAVTVITYAMKTMVPLRIAAIVSSVLFIIYGVAGEHWPVLGMELLLLPFNSWRLWEILSMRRKIAAGRAGAPTDFSVLKSVSRARRVGAGTAILARGDPADALYIGRNIGRNLFFSASIKKRSFHSLFFSFASLTICLGSLRTLPSPTRAEISSR
ncbi:hypothetical protein ROA7023_02741 [Roseisalinus antarcticus]|uniref:Uncharacterized protein n=1 Tax=Roseisalinus antarcticus TaxID=254357 RepID=A0A1Y5TAV9_9RHOB|nr:hypothetical protein [Roseisalinus antarcticus]SLN59657.1 hypothetical protein ROA7023_02741 [Roseisalinus antarcticus]